MKARLLTERRTNQAKMDAKIDSLASQIDCNPEKLDTDLNEMKEEMKAKLDSNREAVTAIPEKIECNQAEMIAKMKVQIGALVSWMDAWLD
jgi:hypothetical protein